jgi:hypothetical protein
MCNGCEKTYDCEDEQEVSIGGGREPAIKIERTNGMGGGHMPSPNKSWHFCSVCGTKLGEIIQEFMRTNPKVGVDNH